METVLRKAELPSSFTDSDRGSAAGGDFELETAVLIKNKQ
jgi:hypothetical protein